MMRITSTAVSLACITLCLALMPSCGAPKARRSVQAPPPPAVSQSREPTPVLVSSAPVQEAPPVAIPPTPPPPVVVLIPPVSTPRPPAEGTIRVECRPVADCSIVSVDGQPVSAAHEVTAAAGGREVVVQAPGVEPVAMIADVPAGGRSELAVVLRPKPALVTFVTRPANATVVVDGRVLTGTTPLEEIPLPPGTHTVEFRPPDSTHLPKSVSATNWEPGGHPLVKEDLDLAPGRARFISGRAWEQLQIDGKLVKAPSNAALELKAGEHKLLARAGRYGTRASFRVPAGSEVAVPLSWRPVAPDPTGYAFVPGTTLELGFQNYVPWNPPHRATLGSFWMKRTEVTVAEYRECVAAGRCLPPGKGEGCNWGMAGRDRHPVNCITAAQAEAYARWLTAAEGLPYRLPNTDEWERSARGADGRRSPWGSEAGSRRCNTCDRSCTWRWKDSTSDDGWEATAPVGALAACVTGEGLLDIIGNVAEWCTSSRHAGAYESRGGGWGSPAAFQDPAFPNQKPRDYSDPNSGFRLVVTEVREQ